MMHSSRSNIIHFSICGMCGMFPPRKVLLGVFGCACVGWFPELRACIRVRGKKTQRESVYFKSIARKSNISYMIFVSELKNHFETISYEKLVKITNPKYPVTHCLKAHQNVCNENTIRVQSGLFPSKMAAQTISSQIQRL